MVKAYKTYLESQVITYLGELILKSIFYRRSEVVPALSGDVCVFLDVCVYFAI